MNKTALITLWIDPREHQIVKYTFDNVWLDFLPAGWLVKVDDIRASMTMGQPFAGVWLPRVINIHAGVTLANGSFEASAERTFNEYRLAEVSTKMRVPKKEDEELERPDDHGPAVAVEEGVRHGSDTGQTWVRDGSDPFEFSNRAKFLGTRGRAGVGIVSNQGLTRVEPCLTRV